jgi:alkanesulfonate monooxygenase SsuD/methylene tetrahydromethanopterin reductase-like flavin-dependent oxidoreductase (luciferase family)
VKKTLRLVARHADIWHSFADLDEFRRKRDILAAHCADVGRDPAEIECSVGAPRADPTEAGPALIEAGAGMFTVAAGGPDYDLTKLRRWLAWRDSL